MGFNWDPARSEEEASRTAILSVQDIRNERLVEQTTVFGGLSDLTELIPRQRGNARRAQRNARKYMQGAAKQYGRVYYVPKKLRRQWAMIWLGSSFLFGAVQFFIYVAVCRWLDLLP